jgi:hypothetical protein
LESFLQKEWLDKIKHFILFPMLFVEQELD